MHMFTLNVITSGRQTITVRSVERGPLSSKDAGTNRVIVKGIDPETSYGQEDLADLARVFAGAGVRWRGSPRRDGFRGCGEAAGLVAECTTRLHSKVSESGWPTPVEL